jgi:dihydrodipicolinate synthase/N-acetylneuraminate lyase
LKYDAVLLSPPSKFVAPNVQAQVDCLAEVLKFCPNTPAFYYHYPIVYRDDFDLVELFELAAASCPTLCGCKLSGCVSLPLMGAFAHPAATRDLARLGVAS